MTTDRCDQATEKRESKAQQQELSVLDLPGADKAPLDVREIPVDEIGIGSNIRVDDYGIESLAESMHANGQLQPCLVRPAPEGAEHGKPFELIFGHRRLRAAKWLREQGKSDWNTLRCEIREIDDDERLAQMIVENYQREDLSPVAEAKAFWTLKYSSDSPLSHAEVARRVGCDMSHVSHRLSMLMNLAPPKLKRELKEMAVREGQQALPAAKEEPEDSEDDEEQQLDILELVDQGQISGSTAEVIASLGKREDQEKLAQLVVRQGWTTKRAAAWARRAKAHDAAAAEREETKDDGPLETLAMPDVVRLERLVPRDDISDEEIARLSLYALLRNGMDRELLDWLKEECGYDWNALWDYVERLTEEQVAELTRRVVLRYISAAHRYPTLELELKARFEAPQEDEELLEKLGLKGLPAVKIWESDG